MYKFLLIIICLFLGYSFVDAEEIKIIPPLEKAPQWSDFCARSRRRMQEIFAGMGRGFAGGIMMGGMECCSAGNMHSAKPYILSE